MRRFLLVLLFVPGLAAAEALAGRVLSVIDGDTLTIVDADKRRHVVRLAEVDAPEKGQPFYMESARSLARICLGKPVEVATNLPPRKGHWLGKVTCDGADAGIEQVRHGMAWARPRQTLPTSPLYETEANARLRQVGLWTGEKPVPPWEWRKQQRAR
jgi:endonuclease YncB( thermonuclease family)